MQSTFWLGGAAVLALAAANPTLAQSIIAAPDDTDTLITIEDNAYHIRGGTQAGANRFHSFQEFGLNTGEMANFLSDPSISNIFGRVTGADASVINGLIQVTGASSNLYLMNPAGLVFGANASLNVGGDFFATTSDRIGFANGWFNATGTNDYATLGGAPNQFAFLSEQPGAILNFGELSTAGNISLLGGTVVNQGSVTTTAGGVTLAVIPGDRLVRISEPGMLLSLEVAAGVLARRLTPADLPTLLTGLAEEPLNNHSVGVSPAPAALNPGDLVITGKVSGETVDLYAAGQVSPHNVDLVQGDTRVIRFSETGENPDQAVFIDRRADHPEQLLYGTEAGTVAQIIESDANGIAVLSDQLASISNAIGELESVAIVAEGNQGSFWLGNQWIRAENITNYATALQTWGNSLTANADILLYSCFTALGSTGEALMSSLASLTGVDVVASVDATGSANYGGDWVLETRTGEITAATPFTPETLASWEGKLLTHTVDSVADDGSGGTTLREAIAAAGAGDLINFDTNGIFGSPQTITLSGSPLEIASSQDNLTIDGSGQSQLLIDGDGASRVFNVQADNATIEDLTIQNGLDSFGGGIRFYGTGTLTLNRTTVTGNTSSSTGGGIMVNRNNTTIRLTDSLVTNNSASRTGGGLNGSSYFTVSLTNSDLTNNHSGGTGGGLYAGGNANITLTNAQITGNQSNNRGGGLYVRDNATLSLDRATVANNAANRGGGIRAIDNLNLTAIDSSFDANTASDGGGIDANDRATLNLTRTNFTNNTATTGGGGIKLFRYADFTLNDSTISGNSASSSNGGGLSVGRYSTVELNAATVSGNSSNRNGGGFYLGDRSQLTLDNTQVSGNFAQQRGGGIYGREAVELNLKNNAQLTTNVANDSGGGIRTLDNGIIQATNATITGNSAQSTGGGIHTESDAQITLTNTMLKNNSAQGNGGGLRTFSNSTVTLSGATVEANISGNHGGGLHLQNSSTVNLNSGTTIAGNSASQNGGGINAYDNATVNLTSASISGNIAGQNGGAIHTQNDGNLKLGNGPITNNQAGTAGGAIASQGNLILKNLNASGNQANTNGGAVYSGGDLTLTGGTITNNSAATGGGINSWGKVAIASATLTGNSAVSGGGIVGRQDITLVDSPLSGNQSSSGLSDGLLSYGGQVGLSVTAGNGDINLTDSIDIRDARSTISLSANNVNIFIPIQSNGGDVKIDAGSNVNDLNEFTVSTTIASSGGDITITAGSNLNLRNLVSANLSGGDAGDISLTSTGGLATTTYNSSEGLINASSSGGNGGNVTIAAASTTTIGSIFTEAGSGRGGNVSLDSDGFVQLTKADTSVFGTDLSVSTGGVGGNGTILIHHGGQGVTPFTIGDASTNGTAGSLSTGNVLPIQTLEPTQAFLFDFVQGDIGILTTIPPVPAPTAPVSTSSVASPPLATNRSPAVMSSVSPAFPAIGANPLPPAQLNPSLLTINNQSLAEHFAQTIGTQLGATTTIDFEDKKFVWDIPGEPVDITGALQLPNFDGDVGAIDQAIEGEYEAYFNQELNLSAKETTLASIREMLTTIERQTGTRAGLIYALSYTDTLELLLITGQAGAPIHREIIPEAEQHKLRSTVRRFRRELSRLSPDYLASAQQLHSWLITPLQAELDGYNLDTLVFVMSAQLRSVPLAALHDGEQFLVEQYSLGMMPSVSLTDSTYHPVANAPVLAMGSSEFQELNPLPAVPLELATITRRPTRTARANHPPFLNETFTFANLQTHSQNSSHQIVHLATHAKFQAGNADESYIQFWRDAVKLPELRSLGWYAQPQVELLVLSACETALGDRQAELGFAGLAVQTGAKSALASLWQVSDVGTLALMNQLYGQLRDPAVKIKAEALRQAQLTLLRGDASLASGELNGHPLTADLTRHAETDLSHPFYWSAFTMVGSPW